MYEDWVYDINGGVFAVRKALGCVWNEEVYEKALSLELQNRGMQVEPQKEFEVFYFDKQVGKYRIDLLVNDTIIVELKVVPEVFPLHQAQLISYLKGYDKPLGMLVNFGGKDLYYRIFPNKVSQLTALKDQFDFEKVTIPHKEQLRELLVTANRVLITLGPGYFHQVYRRAWYYELKTAGADLEVVQEIAAQYQNQVLGSRKVFFFKIGDLLLSAVAVKKLDDLMLVRFRHYIEHLQCRQGLIVNFRALCLDFRYFEIEKTLARNEQQ